MSIKCEVGLAEACGETGAEKTVVLCLHMLTSIQSTKPCFALVGLCYDYKILKSWSRF